MKFKIKFNLFQYDKNHNPTIQKNITISITSDSYDNAYNQVLSKYPNAKSIVIYPIFEFLTGSEKSNKTTGLRDIGISVNSPGCDITNNQQSSHDKPFRKIPGNSLY